MTTVNNLLKRTVKSLGVILDAYSKDRRLQQLPDCILSTQLAIYWMRMEQAKPVEDPTLVEQSIGEDDIVSYSPPTLIGFKDHLLYLEKEFKSITNDLSMITDNPDLPPSTLYNLQRAYDKLHESNFNIELALNYYEQLNRK